MASYFGNVTGGFLNLREIANTGSTRLASIPNGTQLVVSDYSENVQWYCTTYNGNSGFVMKEYIDNLSVVPYVSATVIGGALNLRAAPSTSANSLIQIPNGTSVSVQEHNDTWSSVTYGGYNGFVMTQYLTLVSNNPTPNVTGLFYGVVTTDGGTLNVRSRASSSGSYLGKLPNGRILICENSGTSGWYKIRFQGNDAYVSADYVAIQNQQVHSTYPERINYIYQPELGQGDPIFYDGASGEWCQLFVNWLLRAVHLPTNHVPSTSGTGYGIQFWVRNADFYFKNATYKKKLNSRYSLGVDDTLTTAERNYTPSVGDVIYFRWNNAADDVYVSHTGVVSRVSGGRVYTIEGNAGDDDVVMYRNFSLNDDEIVGYGKPNYSA